MDRLKLTEAEKKETSRLLAENRPLPDKYRFLLFQDTKPAELIWPGKITERWTGDYVFENEWQPFRTKKSRALEFKTPFHKLSGKASQIGFN